MTNVPSETGELVPGHEYSLDEAGGAPLERGDRIVGLTTSGDFNLLELLIADRVKAPWAEHVGESDFLKTPLATELRPEGFYGELRNGIAVITQRNRTFSDCHVAIFANLFSSGRGVRGAIARDVRYWGSNRNAVCRKLGPKTSVKKGKEIAQLLNTESRVTAEAVARFALEHVYSGGLPS